MRLLAVLVSIPVTACSLPAFPPGGGSSVDSGLGEDAGNVDRGDSTTADASVASTPSKVVNNGYVTTGPWTGYGFTATDPGAAQIVPTCGADGCDPPFVGKSFCMHGTVTGRADYTGFAMLGWNVNQDTANGPQQTWAVPATGGLMVTVDNPSKTPLRFQLQGTDPHSSADCWCAPLVSGQLIQWGSLLTNCGTGGKPQNSLAPGTPIQQAAIIVPGLPTDLPFDFCLVDVEIVSGQAAVDADDAGVDSHNGDVGTRMDGAVATGAFEPMCSQFTTTQGSVPTKGGVCAAVDPQLCFKTCGPQSTGFKSETCADGSYQEQPGCSFPTGVDYSCYSVPSPWVVDPTCPASTPQANQPCIVADCVPCNVAGGYLDSSGAPKIGYCVCSWPTGLAVGTWSCSTTTAWPCPGGQGC